MCKSKRRETWADVTEKTDMEIQVALLPNVTSLKCTRRERTTCDFALEELHFYSSETSCCIRISALCSSTMGYTVWSGYTFFYYPWFPWKSLLFCSPSQLWIPGQLCVAGITNPIHSLIRDSFLSRGHGEFSLVSRCRDRVGPWLRQHPLLIPATHCGLAQKQPQQSSVGHHLHHTAAAAPSASSRAQVRDQPAILGLGGLHCPCGVTHTGAKNRNTHHRLCSNSLFLFLMQTDLLIRVVPLHKSLALLEQLSGWGIQ